MSEQLAQLEKKGGSGSLSADVIGKKIMCVWNSAAPYIYVHGIKVANFDDLWSGATVTLYSPDNVLLGTFTSGTNRDIDVSAYSYLRMATDTTWGQLRMTILS